MYRFVLLGGAILVANAYEYRMAIEDDDIKDREHWTAVSRDWYARASDENPRVGRFYHHLAILARILDHLDREATNVLFLCVCRAFLVEPCLLQVGDVLYQVLNCQV